MNRQTHRLFGFSRTFVFAACAQMLAGCAAAPEAKWDEVVLPGVTARATLAVDAAGAVVYAAYPVTGDGQTNVFLSRIGAGGAGEEYTSRVNDRKGDAAAHPQAPPQVALGPGAAVYVSWIAQTLVPGRRFPSSDIRFARSTDGGRTFSPATTVHPDPGYPTSHHFHNMMVDAAGTIYIAWLDGSARDAARQASVGSQGAAAQHGEHGHAHHSGTETDDLPGTELRIARSTDGGRTFGRPVVVARGTCQCCRTALATDGPGRVYIAWRHIFDDGSRDIAVARSDDGGRSFSEPVRVHEDGWAIDGCPHAGPALVADHAGDLHVMWYSGREGGAGVYYARSPDRGQSFGNRVTLAAGIPVSQVALAANRNAVSVAWEDPLRNTVRRAVLNRNMQLDDGTDVPGRLPSLAEDDAIQAVGWAEAGTLHVRYRGIADRR